MGGLGFSNFRRRGKEDHYHTKSRSDNLCALFIIIQVVGMHATDIIQCQEFFALGWGNGYDPVLYGVRSTERDNVLRSFYVLYVLSL